MDRQSHKPATWRSSSVRTTISSAAGRIARPSQRSNTRWRRSSDLASGVLVLDKIEQKIRSPNRAETCAERLKKSTVVDRYYWLVALMLWPWGSAAFSRQHQRPRASLVHIVILVVRKSAGKMDMSIFGLS